MKTICVFLLAFGTFFLAYPLHGTDVILYVILKSEEVNPDCQYICAGCYSQLKMDSPPGEAGTVSTISDSHLSVTVTCVRSNDDVPPEMMEFNWSANIAVSAVIVKAQDTNVYLYDSAVTSDTGLVPPGQNAVSHITFCYVPPQITVQVSGLKDLTVTQPLIRDWSSSGDFRILIGDPSDNTCLTVEVTANVAYNVYICYTYSVSPGTATLDDPANVLFYQYNGTWYSIPYSSSIPCSNMTTLLGLSGTATHTYPVAVDLTQVGDRTAGDSITFTVHVMVTGG